MEHRETECFTPGLPRITGIVFSQDDPCFLELEAASFTDAQFIFSVDEVVLFFSAGIISRATQVKRNSN